MNNEQRMAEDRFMGELALALAPPDVPPGILEAARAVYTWRSIDAELAELTGDSTRSEEVLVGVRGSADAPRTLTFQTTDRTLEVDVTQDSLVGQVLPAEPGTVEVFDALGSRRHVPVSATGAFRVHPLPPAAFRLMYTSDQGGRLATDQIRL